jgi:hypothetical protein
MANNMGKKCLNTNQCGENYLQCVFIDKERKVSNCDDKDVNCGTNKNPTGVCYPLSVTPTVSAVNREIKNLKDANVKNEVSRVMAWVGGIGVILIGFIMYKAKKYIDANIKA